MAVLMEWYPSILGGMEMLAGFHYFARFIGKRAKVLHYIIYLFAMGTIVEKHSYMLLWPIKTMTPTGGSMPAPACDTVVHF